MSAAVLAIGMALPLSAQQHGGHAAQPYKGEQERPIKALPADEVKGYLAGAGMRYALTAELNSYPGPLHSLEHADALGLSAKQRASLQKLMSAHKAEASVIGARLVDAERDLDRLFAERKVTPEALDKRLAVIGALQARYRSSHLRTHLQATRLLEPEQIRRYDQLRGYAQSSPGTPDHSLHR